MILLEVRRELHAEEGRKLASPVHPQRVTIVPIHPRVLSRQAAITSP
jgi:hypothetical protein